MVSEGSERQVARGGPERAPPRWHAAASAWRLAAARLKCVCCALRVQLPQCVMFSCVDAGEAQALDQGDQDAQVQDCKRACGACQPRPQQVQVGLISLYPPGCLVFGQQIRALFQAVYLKGAGTPISPQETCIYAYFT